MTSQFEFASLSYWTCTIPIMTRYVEGVRKICSRLIYHIATTTSLGLPSSSIRHSAPTADSFLLSSFYHNSLYQHYNVIFFTSAVIFFTTLPILLLAQRCTVAECSSLVHHPYLQQNLPTRGTYHHSASTSYFLYRFRPLWP